MDTPVKKSNTVLQSEHIQLVPFAVDHWKCIASWFFDDSYSHMWRQFTKVPNEDDFKAYPNMIRGEVFMICGLSNNNIIGMVQIIPDWKKNKAGYLGMLIVNEYQGKRLPVEVLYVVLGHAFNRQGYNKIILEILEEDEGIKRSLEKTGFYREGKLLQDCFFEGRFVNELRYSMTAKYYNKFKDKVLQDYVTWCKSLQPKV